MSDTLQFVVTRSKFNWFLNFGGGSRCVLFIVNVATVQGKTGRCLATDNARVCDHQRLSYEPK